MYPTLILIQEQTPIPIEYVYFLEDGEQDPTKPNRYYFNFPQDWVTSNRGESIIGVRSIWMIARRRKMVYTIKLRKYYRSNYNELKEKVENKNKTDDEIYELIPENRKSEWSTNVITWMESYGYFRDFWNGLMPLINDGFKAYNSSIESSIKTEIKIMDRKIEMLEKHIDESTNKYIDLMVLIENETDANTKAQMTEQAKKLKTEMEEKNKEIEKIKKEKQTVGKPTFNRLDLQLDGYYDYQNLKRVQEIYAITNRYDSDQYGVMAKNNLIYYVDISISFYPRSVINGIQDNTIDQKYDFVDVFNIGINAYQNNPAKYLDMNKPIIDKKGNIVGYEGKWLRELKFDYVWDRHSCKLYSSIAEESNKGYLGNSQIYFNPIKYFKLNSTDQRFWVEFYSGRHNKIPVSVPLNESFIIEMIFLPFKKMLYI